MNRKFKLSGFLIFLTLSLSLIGGFTINLYDFVHGFTRGLNRSQQEDYQLHLLLEAKDLQAEPANQLKLLNQKDNKVYTLQLEQPAEFTASLEELPSSIILLQTGIGLLTIVLYLLAFNYFFKFILAVNKGKLFEKRNLKLLNRLGFCLISTFFLEILFYFANYQLATDLFDFQAYTIPFSSSFSFIQLISGLSALMASQILSIAKEMKEEQELTI